MFFDAILCALIVGIIMLALVTFNAIFMCIMYLIYKADGGRMSFRKYTKYW